MFTSKQDQVIQKRFYEQIRTRILHQVATRPVFTSIVVPKQSYRFMSDKVQDDLIQKQIIPSIQNLGYSVNLSNDLQQWIFWLHYKK